MKRTQNIETRSSQTETRPSLFFCLYISNNQIVKECSFIHIYYNNFSAWEKCIIYGKSWVFAERMKLRHGVWETKFMTKLNVTMRKIVKTLNEWEMTLVKRPNPWLLTHETNHFLNNLSYISIILSFFQRDTIYTNFLFRKTIDMLKVTSVWTSASRDYIIRCYFCFLSVSNTHTNMYDASETRDEDKNSQELTHENRKKCLCVIFSSCSFTQLH